MRHLREPRRVMRDYTLLDMLGHMLSRGPRAVKYWVAGSFLVVAFTACTAIGTFVWMEPIYGEEPAGLAALAVMFGSGVLVILAAFGMRWWFGDRIGRWTINREGEFVILREPGNDGDNS